MVLSITRRFITLLALGILILMFSLILHNPMTIFIIYNVICATLLIIDFFISNEKIFIEVERCGEAKLSIFEKEAISIKLYNKSNRNLKVEIKDEVPEFHFTAEQKIMSGILKPHEKKLFQYYVVPSKRGTFTFGNIHVRYEGKLKLCTRIFKIEQKREYKVYPNMKNLRKYRMTLNNKRDLSQGQRNLKLLGRGTSFESLREYVYGDEYRKINWQASARENKIIVNQYEPEKNQHVYMFIDTGRPMSYTIKGFRKLDLVVNTALVMSDIVNQNGDQSGLLLFNTNVNNMIMPGKGAVHRNKMLEALYHIDHTNQSSNYDEAFYYFKGKERHRSIIFLFTDFDTAEEAHDMLKPLSYLAKNNLVVITLIRSESLEALSNIEVKTKEELFNKGVALQLVNDRKNIIKLLNRKGILCIECEAEKLELAVINKYIQIKNKAMF